VVEMARRSILPRAMRIPAVVTLALLTTFVACKSNPPPPSSSTADSASAGATAAPPSSGEVKVGQEAPDFTTRDHAGQNVSLSALKGKPVVVYFYPKDETSGCTKEASSFRDAWKDFEKNGVVVIGISTDSLDSHRSFAKNHDLPFHLVSDPDGNIAKAYGVPSHLGFLSRQTFIIGADGNVKKIYRDVDVSKHASEVLADVSS